MLQNNAALKRTKYANSKTNRNISYSWENDSVFDQLAKKKKLKDQPCNQIFAIFKKGSTF